MTTDEHLMANIPPKSAPVTPKVGPSSSNPRAPRNSRVNTKQARKQPAALKENTEWDGGGTKEPTVTQCCRQSDGTLLDLSWHVAILSHNRNAHFC